jgi:hypothetical protein
MPAMKSLQVCESLSVTRLNTVNSSSSKKKPCYRPSSSAGGMGKNKIILKKFVEECNNLGIQVIDEELKELDTYLNFLSRHVITGEGCRVPCMLLWSEWAKFCMRQTQKFPAFIHENEFRYLILQQFNLSLRQDSSAGVIYSGLEFVSDKTKRMIENTAHV